MEPILRDALTRPRAKRFCNFPPAKMPIADLQRAHAATVDPYIGRGACYMGPVLDERTLVRHPFYPDAQPARLDLGTATRSGLWSPAPLRAT